MPPVKPEPGDLVMVVIEGQYEISAVGTTPDEAMRLAEAAYNTFWADESPTFEFADLVEGAGVKVRVLRAGVAYVDGSPVGVDESWVWSPDTPDGRYPRWAR